MKTTSTQRSQRRRALMLKRNQVLVQLTVHKDDKEYFKAMARKKNAARMLVRSEPA